MLVHEAGPGCAFLAHRHQGGPRTSPPCPARPFPALQLALYPPLEEMLGGAGWGERRPACKRCSVHRLSTQQRERVREWPRGLSSQGHASAASWACWLTLPLSAFRARAALLARVLASCCLRGLAASPSVLRASGGWHPGPAAHSAGLTSPGLSQCCPSSEIQIFQPPGPGSFVGTCQLGKTMTLRQRYHRRSHCSGG